MSIDKTLKLFLEDCILGKDIEADDWSLLLREAIDIGSLQGIKTAAYKLGIELNKEILESTLVSCYLYG